MLIDLVGRTGHDEGPCVYRSCKKEAVAGRNQVRDIHLSRNRAPDSDLPMPRSSSRGFSFAPDENTWWPQSLIRTGNQRMIWKTGRATCPILS